MHPALIVMGRGPGGPARDPGDRMAYSFDTSHAPRIGAVEEVAPGIRAVTAPNGGAMTFTGTRSYLVGTGEVALVDPGPDSPAHLAALMAALAPGERITHVIVTHTHLDHSPLAAAVQAATGAPTHGFGPHGAGMSPVMRALTADGAALGGGEGADLRFHPDVALADGARIEGGDWALTALHMPGHLSNHLCLALEGQGVLFTGDLVMGWASTLVSPPDGDVAAFRDSLRRLQARDDRLCLPGHGGPVTDPQALVAHLLAHRAGREAEILGALEGGPRDIAALTALIYSSVDPRLHGAAARNVLAHLIDLAGRGLVEPLGPLSATARFRRA